MGSLTPLLQEICLTGSAEVPQIQFNIKVPNKLLPSDYEFTPSPPLAKMIPVFLEITFPHLCELCLQSKLGIPTAFSIPHQPYVDTLYVLPIYLRTMYVPIYLPNYLPTWIRSSLLSC